MTNACGCFRRSVQSLHYSPCGLRQGMSIMDKTDERKYLTDPDSFRDVSRGNPKPHTLKGDALVKARLTPETWRLEIVSDGSSKIDKPMRLEDNSAVDLPALLALGKKHGVRFLKAM